MMRQIAIALVALTAASLTFASPAGGLSCAPPEPIDWMERFPRLEAALIVEVEAVADNGDGTLSGSLQVSTAVVEVLKGDAGKRLDYEVPSFNPWGPYYEVGDVVAVIIEDGVISDGRQNICGPWFEPSELRQAADRYGDVEAPPLPDRPPEPTTPDPVTPGPFAPQPEPKPEIDVPAGGLRSILQVMLELVVLILGILGLR